MRTALVLGVKMKPQNAAKRLQRPTKSSSIVLISILLVACSSAGPNYLRKDLANQGPMVLSHDNPYIAPNLLLSNEINASPLMGGFVKHRGVPDAVEVTKKWMKPFRIYFFYLGHREAYLFQDGEEEWLIRGPEKIPDEIMIKFGNVRAGIRKPALMEKTVEEATPLGSSTVLRPRESTGPNGRSHQTATLTPPPSTGWQGNRETPQGREATPSHSAYPSPGQPLEGAPPPGINQEQKSPDRTLPPATRSAGTTAAQNTVVESASGDIIHRVVYPGETLRIIASWFTDSPENADRIARINGIDDPNLLRMHQEIRIPRYLLKRSEPLPEAEVKRYLESVSNVQPQR